MLHSRNGDKETNINVENIVETWTVTSEGSIECL